MKFKATCSNCVNEIETEEYTNDDIIVYEDESEEIKQGRIVMFKEFLKCRDYPICYNCGSLNTIVELMIE